MSTARVSFWEGNHPLQDRLIKLEGELVPARGAAETRHGELLRCISRFYWDYNNNGNGNVLEREDVECEDCFTGYVDCDCCNGTGRVEPQGFDDEDEEDLDDECPECRGDGNIPCSYCDEGVASYTWKFDSWYEEWMNTLLKYIGTSAEELKSFILGSEPCHYSYDQEEMDIYHRVFIDVLKYIDEHENVPFDSSSYSME